MSKEGEEERTWELGVNGTKEMRGDEWKTKKGYRKKELL